MQMIFTLLTFRKKKVTIVPQGLATFLYCAETKPSPSINSKNVVFKTGITYTLVKFSRIFHKVNHAGMKWIKYGKSKNGIFCLNLSFINSFC